MAFRNIGALTFQGKIPPTEYLRLQNSLKAGRVEACLERTIADEERSVGLFQATIVEADESQTVMPRELSSWIVCDARIDNCSILSQSIGGLRSSTSTDELILAAYKAWGTDCARHLRGDFAFVIWDESQQQLFAARDMFGVRALAYARDADRIVVASTLGGVLAGLRTRPRPNYDYLREFITGRVQSPPGPTAYGGVRWLPPGHRLILRGERLEVERYDQLRPIQFAAARPADVFAEFRARLTTAVERRLPSTGPVAMLVSGGFDSSSIAGLANEAVRQGRTRATLRAYSATYERDREADERSYLRAVIAKCEHVTGIELPSDDARWSVASLWGNDGFPMEEPPRGPRIVGADLLQMARRDGCRVVLSGTWADQLLLRGAYNTPQLWWDLPIRHATAEWTYFYRAAGWYRMLRSIVRGAPRRIRRALSGLGLVDTPRTASAALIAARVVSKNDPGVVLASDILARWTGTEMGYPYLDRDLHEFVLGLPVQYFFGEGLTKKLQRVGLADVLPDVFQQRTTFSHVRRIFVEGMRSDRVNVEAHLAARRTVAAGLMSDAEHQQLIASLSSGDITPYLVRIQNAVGVEEWLARELGDSIKQSSAQ